MGLSKERNGRLDGAYDAEYRSSQCTSVTWHGMSFCFRLLDSIWADWDQTGSLFVGDA